MILQISRTPDESLSCLAHLGSGTFMAIGFFFEVSPKQNIQLFISDRLSQIFSFCAKFHNQKNSVARMQNTVSISENKEYDGLRVQVEKEIAMVTSMPTPLVHLTALFLNDCKCLCHCLYNAGSTLPSLTSCRKMQCTASLLPCTASQFQCLHCVTVCHCGKISCGFH